MSQKCEAFVETGNFRDFSDGIVKELSIYIMLVPETLYKELSTFSTGFSTKAKPVQRNHFRRFYQLFTRPQNREVHREKSGKSVYIIT